MTDPERQLAAETQNKFQFYLLALVFTILGLAVQTSPPHTLLTPLIAELLAWVLLLISGLAGLSYIEWGPAIRIAMASRDDDEAKITLLWEASRSGIRDVTMIGTNEKVPIDQRINETQERLPKLEAHVVALNGRSKWKYRAFKWGFVAGLLALCVSRGYNHAALIARATSG